METGDALRSAIALLRDDVYEGRDLTALYLLGDVRDDAKTVVTAQTAVPIVVALLVLFHCFVEQHATEADAEAFLQDQLVRTFSPRG
jgi:hypothetical protein